MTRHLALIVLLISCTPEKTRNSSGHEPPKNATVAQKELNWPPPEAFLLPEDQERARRRDPRDASCLRTRTEDGVEVESSLPTEACVRMLPRQRFRGVWLNRFEGSSFTPDTHTFPTQEPHIWLNVDRLKPRPHEFDGRAYLVEFDGRQTMYRWSYGPCCFDTEIVVDRLISATPLREGAGL